MYVLLSFTHILDLCDIDKNLIIFCRKQGFFNSVVKLCVTTAKGT